MEALAQGLVTAAAKGRARAVSESRVLGYMKWLVERTATLRTEDAEDEDTAEDLGDVDDVEDNVSEDGNSCSLSLSWV